MQIQAWDGSCATLRREAATECADADHYESLSKEEAALMEAIARGNALLTDNLPSVNEQVSIETPSMVYKRAIWAVIEQGIGPLIALLSTPILLQVFSQTDFAIWVLALAVIGMSQLLSVGLPPICTKEAAIDISECNGAFVGSIIGTALLTTTIVSTLVALPITLFADQIASHLFQNIGDMKAVSLALRLALAIAVLQELEVVTVTGLKADEQYGFSAKVELCSRIVLYGTILLVAILSKAVTNSLAAYLVAALVKLTVKLYALKSHYSGKNERRKSLRLGCSWPQFKKLLVLSKWQWIQSISGLIYTSTDRLLIASYLGSAQLTVYAIALTLTQQTHAVVVSATQILVPMISKKRQIDAREILRVLNAATLATLLIPLPVHILLITSGEWIVSIWTQANCPPELLLVIKLLTLNFAILCLSAPSYFTLIALGETRISTAIILSSAVAQLLMSIVTIEHGIVLYSMSRLVYALGALFLYYVARRSIIRASHSL